MMNGSTANAVADTSVSTSMYSYANTDWKFLKANTKALIDSGAKLDELVLRILLNRGFSKPKEIGQLLNTSFKNTICDPSLVLDMDKAVERIYKAIAEKERVAIFGDYDVDGVTSTFLLVDVLRRNGLDPTYHLPNRLTDGYGLTKEFIDECKTNGISLVITTDCGIGAIEETEYANSQNIDVVIFDHHVQLIDKIPPAIAVVDANRQEQQEVPTAYLKHLCAAGIVFMFLIALRRYIRNRGGQLLFNPTDYVDIVALGTVSDLVQLLGINRALVIHVLKGKVKSLGIKAMMAILSVSDVSTVEDISFRISPLINAAGRLGQADKALELLFTTNKQDAVARAYELLALNDKRRVIEAEILTHALQSAEAMQKNKSFVCSYGDNWHEGVMGIISGKLRERFNKPSFVISFNAKGEGHGSARSVPGLHIGELINSAVEAGILLKGGGHEMAGGFSLLKSNIDRFMKFLEGHIPTDIKTLIEIDACLSPLSKLENIVKKLQILEPFGQGLMRPVFAMLRLQVANIRYIADGQHARIVFKDEFGRGLVRTSLFNSCMNQPFIDRMFTNSNQLYDIVGVLTSHRVFGPSIILKDIRISQ